jgi:hypothetical protein
VESRKRAPTKTSGQGRPKGIPNKLTTDIKDMILNALRRAGGPAYLLRQAELNPVAFMALVGKILPLQVTGKDGGPVQYQNIDAPSKENREQWLARMNAMITPPMPAGRDIWRDKPEAIPPLS